MSVTFGDETPVFLGTTGQAYFINYKKDYTQKCWFLFSNGDNIYLRIVAIWKPFEIFNKKGEIWFPNLYLGVPTNCTIRHLNLLFERINLCWQFVVVDRHTYHERTRTVLHAMHTWHSSQESFCRKFIYLFTCSTLVVFI